MVFITWKIADDSQLITLIPRVPCIPPSHQHWFSLFHIWTMISTKCFVDDASLVQCEVAYYHVKHTVVEYDSGDQQLENEIHIL